MIVSYEDLEVYQKAYECAIEVHTRSLAFPKMEQYELASQIRRSTKSITANIAEGHGRKTSAAEFKRFLGLAKGSANETRVHLKYCKDLGYLTEAEYQNFDGKYIEIIKMLTKLAQVWK